jgi:hypothetical protein
VTVQVDLQVLHQALVQVPAPVRRKGF